VRTCVYSPHFKVCAGVSKPFCVS